MKLELTILTDPDTMDEVVHDTLVEAVSEALSTVWKSRLPISIDGTLRQGTGQWAGFFQLILKP